MLKISTKTSPLAGKIDRIASGFVCGWAYSSELENLPVNVFIALDGVIVGQSKADQFREDLLNAGVGNGQHAFSWQLNLPSRLIDGKSLQLLDENHWNIGSSHKIPTSYDRNLKIKRLAVVNHSLGIDVDALKSETPTLQIYHGNGLFWQAAVSLEKGTNYLEIPLNLNLVDGMYHLFTVGSPEQPICLWRGTVFIPLLENSFETYRLVDNSTSEDINISRYQSLSSQLNRAKDSKILNIINANKFLTTDKELNRGLASLALPMCKKPKVSIVLNFRECNSYYTSVISSLILAGSDIEFEVLVGLIGDSPEFQLLKSKVENLVLVSLAIRKNFKDDLAKVMVECSGDAILVLNGATEVSSYFVDHLFSSMDKFGANVVGGKLVNIYHQHFNGVNNCKDSELLNNNNNQQLGHPENSFVKPVDCFNESPFIIDRRSLIKHLETDEVWQNKSVFFDSLFSKLKREKKLIIYNPFIIAFDNKKRDFSSDFVKCLSGESLVIEDNRKPVILMLDYSTPKPDRDAGSYAAINEIKVLMALGFRVIFIADDLVYSYAYTQELQKLGVEVLYAPFYASAKEAVEDKLPRVCGVYITRYQIAKKYTGLIRAFSEDLPIILNLADLHFLREARSATLSGDAKAMEQALKTRDSELSVIGEVDAVLSYSDVEIDMLLSEGIDKNSLYKCPWLVDVKKAGPTFEERSGIAFLGGYGHYPNREALQYFVSEVIPLLIKRNPAFKIYFYGSDMPESFKVYENNNVIIKGYAKSLDHVYSSHKIFIAPLLSGAGIKGKVLDSAAYGLPCILSPTAIESTGLIDGHSALLAKEPDSWVANIEKLYFDENLWNLISRNQRKLVKDKYSFTNAKKMMALMLQEVGLLK